MAHIGEHIGAPDIEILEEAVQEDQRAGVAATFVAIVYVAAIDGDDTVLFPEGG